MDLLAQGLTGEQVADKLVLSSETVKTHIRNAMAKLEASTRVHAIAIALREGYIQPPASDGNPLMEPDDERRPRLRHDLRTPLTIVSGFAEVLAGDRADLRRRPARVRLAHPRRRARDRRAGRPAARRARRPRACLGSPTRSTSARARATNASRWWRSNCSQVVKVRRVATRSRNRTPSRWSSSCWKVPAVRPRRTSSCSAPSRSRQRTRTRTWRSTSPRRSGTDRQPSLIATVSSSSGSITGFTSTVSGIGGLYG